MHKRISAGFSWKILMLVFFFFFVEIKNVSRYPMHAIISNYQKAQKAHSALCTQVPSTLYPVYLVLTLYSGMYDSLHSKLI